MQPRDNKPKSENKEVVTVQKVLCKVNLDDE